MQQRDKRRPTTLSLYITQCFLKTWQIWDDSQQTKRGWNEKERERKKSGRKTLLKMDSFTTFKREERKKSLPKASLRAAGLAVAMDVVQQLIIMAVTNANWPQ